MRKYIWAWLIALLVIHSLDMSLTQRYVGDNWENETFWPMSQTIRLIGVFNACWISRLNVYPFVFACLMWGERRWLYNLLITVTLLYWTAMLGWLFRFEILVWPWE